MFICSAAAMKERCPPEDSKSGEFPPTTRFVKHITLLNNGNMQK